MTHVNFLCMECTNLVSNGIIDRNKNRKIYIMIIVDYSGIAIAAIFIICLFIFKIITYFLPIYYNSFKVCILLRFSNDFLNLL